jgi:hypothetical protein
MTATPDAEGERLKAAELEAEKRYYKAVHKSDLSDMRAAAVAWRQAREALGEFLEALYPHSSRG